MGLFNSAKGAAGGVMADQWKEFFYCEAIDVNILVVKGRKRLDARSSNTQGADNIISSGSVIAVADGQAMMIVEQGKIVEFCAEPGEFIYDASTEPSIFDGRLGSAIKKTFANIGKRFEYGGQPPKDQRVYYFNLKEIVSNKYGTQNPVPFRVIDTNIGLDADIPIRCNGEYSYRLINPLLFYENVCGNVESAYHRDQIDDMLNSELLNALQPAFAEISKLGIRYSALPGHTTELSQALNGVLSQKWSEKRGISISSFAINSVTASPEHENMIIELQRNAVMRNSGMAGATIVAAQADAMKNAADNSGGAFMGFLGMNAAMNSAANAGSFFDREAQQQAQSHNTVSNDWKCECGADTKGNFCCSCGKPKPSNYRCECGAIITGSFCNECGKSKPEEWLCECGKTSTGNFCNNCGKSKP